jgi:hypothetical protein
MLMAQNSRNKSCDGHGQQNLDVPTQEERKKIFPFSDVCSFQDFKILNDACPTYPVWVI